MDHKIQVDVDSHPRGDNISVEELQQALKDYQNWLKDNAKPAYEKIQTGASAQQIKQMREEIKFDSLHIMFQKLLEQINGGLQLHDSFLTLSTDDIISIQEVNAVSGYWKNNYITFGQDQEQNYLILENDTGKVLSWNNDEGIQEELSTNLGLYIEKIRNQVLKKQLEYVEEIGLVENQN
ncbi:hypothetical protein PPERSA_02154 [Pseudocohnilembus persalinus]|uniref:Knr4/Smi1-like domain-containing protein n=1 Tax=Pseudocohnilembus persalinus TaxID=266149 RepID=A0A0V0Q7I7_PSEPJ|nr:hypothetical protein PPERSA_02154 [Pseudocohnilembus persalinus]|eukprot:KRW98176.1 hypothetical protein PPERSA_02154 [Pseudocohnilembus persalinus]